jgi:hypothetical protein
MGPLDRLGSDGRLSARGSYATVAVEVAQEVEGARLAGMWVRKRATDEGAREPWARL